MQLLGVFILGLWTLTHTGGTDALYEWSCSALDTTNNRYTLPDLAVVENSRNVLVNEGSLSPSIRDVLYIYPIPALNCSGTVSAVAYCYYDGYPISDSEQPLLVFTLLTLEQNGPQFMITDVIGVRSTPTNLMCTNSDTYRGQYCCDAMPLETVDQFRLPASKFAFGIVPSRFFIFLEFDRLVTPEYVVEQYTQAIRFDSLTVGNTISVGGVDTENTIRLFQLHITPDDAPDDNASGSQVGAAVGGVVGVGVAVGLLVGITIVVIVVLKRRRAWKPDESATEGSNYPNAVYGQNESGGKYETVQDSAAGIGRSGHNEQIAQGQGHEYALVGGGERSNAHTGASNGAYEVVTQVKEQSEGTETEGIYQVPAKDESTLYAQLTEIFTSTITRDTVLLGDLLGSGQFGTVYKGVWQSPTKGEVEVAVKTLKKGSKKKDRVKFLQEVAIMGQFKHPNVVEMYGVVTIGEPVLLVLEMLARGNLQDYLVLHMRSGGVTVDGHTLLSYCRQVASGMVYLSSKAFVHRDIAARNILVSEDNSCKIADFGMSRDLMDENYYVSHGGKIPVKWTAPEALHYKKYSTASDVWSYGALMYEIWSVGHKPFEHHPNNKVLKLVDTGYRLPPPPGCPRALYAIMMSCWHQEKSKRPCFTDISHQLSLSDTELLKWAEEDKSTHPEVDKLGADLLYAQDLYKDLQVIYKQDPTLSTNPAYGVGTDGVAVSTNPAYGVNTGGVAVSTNPAGMTRYQ